MERPRRPAPGRRSAERRSERVRGSIRRVVGDGPAPTSGSLTTRAAVLGLVLCALLVSAALPLREYLSQRGQLGSLTQTLAAQRSRVSALEEQRSLLTDPTYVASLARERLHFVKPGETTYVVLGAQDPSLTVPVVAPPAPGVQSPWWSQLYGSVRSADARPAGR